MASVFQTAAKTLVLNETSQATTVAVEEAQNRRIAAARERKEARRQRFLNARERTIGIDVDYIAKQQAEHKAAAQKEKEEEMRYVREQAAIDRALENFELQVEAQRKLKTQQTKEEWKRQQAMRKLDPNYVLNDKDALKKDRPARVGDNDPRLGPASLQVFDGEDLREAERRELQHKQMKNWCIEENMLKRVAKIKELEDEFEYRRFMERVEEMRKAADAAAEEEAAAQRAAVKAKNAQLVAAAAAERAKLREEEEKMNQAELQATLAGGILSEDPADGRSALGRNRKRPDHYRGMSQAEVARYRALQEEQRREVARRKEAERKADREDARRQNEVLRAAARIEAAQAEQARIAAAQYKATLDQQRIQLEARAAKERADALEPGITDGFFGGFGQSDR